MTDVFQCGYCGEMAELHAAHLSWWPGDVAIDTRPAGHGQPVQLYHPTVHCSPHCARMASSSYSAGRG